MNEDKIDNPNEALYLVEIQDCKEPKIVNNAEMTLFYKDALIHYYQKIHFDWELMIIIDILFYFGF